MFHNEFKRILCIDHSYSRLLPHTGYKSIAAILLWGSLCRVFPRIEQISLTAGPNRLPENPIHSGSELLNVSSLKSGAGQSFFVFFLFFFFLRASPTSKKSAFRIYSFLFPCSPHLVCRFGLAIRLVSGRTSV